MSSTTHEPSIVDDPAALEHAVDWVARAPLVAVDTEFVREKTYYPKLCLIQLANDDQAACVDCLAPLDLKPLLAALFRPDCTWVLHSARQDLEVIWQRAGRLPASLVDTQIAAALIGFAPQIGLEGLLAKTLRVELGESYARTDWSRRPLPSAAVRYALDDVRFLLPAWRQLKQRLAELGRLGWVEEDSGRLLAERPVADPVVVWTRLKGLQALPFPQRCAALSLVRWREAEAERKDRPRRWILADEAVLAVAAALPGQRSELEGLLPPRLVAKQGAAILAAVAHHADPEIQGLVHSNPAAPAADKTTLKRLQAEVRRRAAELGIEPEILATRRDLAALATGRTPEGWREGWRAAQLAGLQAPPAP
jgi:ribonuclease D